MATAPQLRVGCTFDGVVMVVKLRVEHAFKDVHGGGRDDELAVRRHVVHGHAFGPQVGHDGVTAGVVGRQRRDLLHRPVLAVIFARRVGHVQRRRLQLVEVAFLRHKNHFVVRVGRGPSGTDQVVAQLDRARHLHEHVRPLRRGQCPHRRDTRDQQRCDGNPHHRHARI